MKREYIHKLVFSQRIYGGNSFSQWWLIYSPISVPITLSPLIVLMFMPIREFNISWYWLPISIIVSITYNIAFNIICNLIYGCQDE
jgi:uncharacterized membrane protein YhaH (DUF805 family)